MHPKSWWSVLVSYSKICGNGGWGCKFITETLSFLCRGVVCDPVTLELQLGRNVGQMRSIFWQGKRIFGHLSCVLLILRLFVTIHIYLWIMTPRIPSSHQVHFSIAFSVKVEIHSDRRGKSLDSGHNPTILLDSGTLLKSFLKNIFLFTMKHNLNT